MKTNYLKEMRIARYCIRQGLPNAQKVWAQKVSQKRSKEISRLKNKGYSSTIAMSSFIPLDFDEDFIDIPILYCKGYCSHPNEYKKVIDYHNPIVDYSRGSFHFSETQLKNALKATVGDSNSLYMTICEHQPGNQLSEVAWNMKLRDFKSRMHFIGIRDKLKLCFENFSCTECRLSYLGNNMVIYRFPMKNSQEGLVYLYPSTELSGCPVEMDESSFYQLDLIALLLDMADEVHERQDIITSFRKKQIMKRMSCVANDKLNLEFVDKEFVTKLAIEYFNQGIDYYSALRLMKKNLLEPLKDFFEDCVLSHPESNKNCFNISQFQIYRGVWTISLKYNRHRTRNAFELRTENSEEEFSFILDNGMLNQYALDHYLEHVETYALQWFYLSKHFYNVFPGNK